VSHDATAGIFHESWWRWGSIFPISKNAKPAGSDYYIRAGRFLFVSKPQLLHRVALLLRAGAQVAHGGLGILVPEQSLDGREILTGDIQLRRERFPQLMWMDF